MNHIAAPDSTATTRRFAATRHDGLDAVETTWRALQRGGVCTAYQGIEWATCLASLLARDKRATLFVIEIMDGSSHRPLMLLPFVLRRLFLRRVIEFLDLGVCDYAAPVLAAGVELTADEAHAAWRAARSALPRADLLRIDGVPSHVFGVANPLALLPQARHSGQEAFGLALHGDPDTLLKRLCVASFVRDIGKASRRLARQGEIRFVVATSEAEVDGLFAELLEQRLQRFHDLGRFDLLRQPGVAAFYRDAALRSLEAGPVRLFGVSVGGEWIATAYCLVHAGAVHGSLLAMAGGRWRNASPGLYMITEIMRWARAEGLSYFDLTVGAPAYKADMGARSHALLEIAEALTLRGWLMMRIRSGSQSFFARLRRHPQMFARLRRLRRAARKYGL